MKDRKLFFPAKKSTMHITTKYSDIVDWDTTVNCENNYNYCFFEVLFFSNLRNYRLVCTILKKTAYPSRCGDFKKYKIYNISFHKKT
jgi:hypothetical protein